MGTLVSHTKAAESAVALQHFEAMLSFETDCWDVHESLQAAEPDFILLDVRSHDQYAAGHVPGAVSMPRGKIIASRMAIYAGDMLFVVYCAGPHCNGANKAAVRLAQLNLSVKMMIGGVTGWLDEGFLLTRVEPEPGDAG
ncbi:MAG: rhodanese-like domain-containing protein [Granulosicoccus sp.]